MTNAQRPDRQGPGEPRWATQLAAALAILALGWTLVVVAAPLLRARGSTPARGWIPVLPAVAYQAGSLVCHQRPERSFHVAGEPLVVCARCFGLYVAGAAGLLLAWGLRSRWPSRWVRLALAVGVLPIAITVALESVGAIDTSNVLRMATGVPPGLIGGLVVTGLLRGTA